MEKYRHTQYRWTPTERPYPANQAQVYRALLHQTHITYGEVQTYPVQKDPPKRGLTWLIEPKCTEPYYTKDTLHC